MAQRGRKPLADPPVELYISIPTSLAAKLDLLLMDPVLLKPKYGGRSGLIQLLLREWVDKQIGHAPASTPTP